MKFICERRAFLNAATMAMRASERRSAIPILMHLKIAATKIGVTLTGTNVDKIVAVTVDATISKTGALTVDAEKTVFFAKNAPEGCQIECEETKDDQVTFRAGRARITLQTLPVSHFPDPLAGEFPATIRVHGPGLAKALGSVAHAQANDDARPYLNGTLFHEDGGRLALVACDGDSFARAIIDTVEPAAFTEIIVPRQATEDLRRMAEASSDVELDVSETRLRVRAGGITLTTKLLDGTYPDYRGRGLIPQDGPDGFVTSKAAMEAATLRCSTLADNYDRTLKLSVRGAVMSIEARGSQGGDVFDEIDVQSSGAPVVTGVSAKRIKNALAAIDGPDVSCNFGKERHAIVLRDLAAPDSLQLIGTQRV